MPDFDRLHVLTSKLAALTEPGEQEPGLASWCVFVGETWKEIVSMWSDKAAASTDMYTALEQSIKLIRAWHGMPFAGRPQGAKLEAEAWAIYFEHAPEMQPLKLALAKANPERPTGGQ